MSNKVWTTTSNREDNLRMFGLSISNKLDYPTFYLLDQIIEKNEQQKEEWKILLKNSIEINKPYNAKHKIDQTLIPKILYGHNIRKDIELPSFCRTPEGYQIVNEECANILKKFRLGETAMYPLSFFDLALNEPVNDKTYYFLNIAEWRHYLLPEFSSSELDKKKYKNEIYDSFRLYHSDYEDGAIAVSEQAINCDLDLWHDPALISSIFMSDKLKQALNEAGMEKDWLLYSCKLIQQS